MALHPRGRRPARRCRAHPRPGDAPQWPAAYAILDGTLILTDRLSGSQDRRYFSGKHRRHGVNAQVIADPHGRLIWVSPALPGSVHDLTAARTHGIITALTRAAVATFADKG